MSAIWRTCCYQDGSLVLLLAMADHGKDDGTDIYPGVDLLAAKCRSSVRAIQERLKKLRADGVVKIVGNNGIDLPDDETPVGGRGRKTEYRIDLERVQELHALHQQESPQCEHCRARAERVRRRARKGAARSTKGEDARAPYRIEPLETPLNLPSEAARAPVGRVIGQVSEPIANAIDVLPLSGKQRAKLVGLFEPTVLAAWFAGVRFREGPPLVIVLASRCKCSWVQDKFGDRLRRAFGDDLKFDYEREQVDDA